MAQEIPAIPPSFGRGALGSRSGDERVGSREPVTRRLSVLAGWRPYLSFFLSFFSFFSFAVSLALLVFALGFLSLLFAMLRGYTG